MVLHLQPFVGEGVVQHPHAALIAARQTERVHLAVIVWLGVLQLVEVFVKHSYNPGCGSFLSGVFSLTDDDSRDATHRKRRQQIRWLSSLAIIDFALQQRVVMDQREIRRRFWMTDQELVFRRD